MEEPKIGWSTPVHEIRVIDGDTVCVKITREITVRITDDDGTFNTPEVRRASEEEKIQGRLAKEELKDIIEGSERVTLFVPTSEKLADAFSIGARAVGFIFADGVDVAEELTKRGFNKSEKQRPEDH